MIFRFVFIVHRIVIPALRPDSFLMDYENSLSEITCNYKGKWKDIETIYFFCYNI